MLSDKNKRKEYDTHGSRFPGSHFEEGNSGNSFNFDKLMQQFNSQFGDFSFQGFQQRDPKKQARAGHRFLNLDNLFNVSQSTKRACSSFSSFPFHRMTLCSMASASLTHFSRGCREISPPASHAGQSQNGPVTLKQRTPSASRACTPPTTYNPSLPPQKVIYKRICNI